MAVSDYFNTVQKLYIAFYQRPADPAGLYYWAQRMEAAKGSLEGVIDAFATSAEATALYGAINNDTIGSVIDKLYQALFNRAPDAAGKQFYVDGFKAGTFTAGKIAMDVLNGASAADAVAIQNKLEVSNLFTKALDPEQDGIGPFTATYSGNADVTTARTWLAGVTSDPATRKTESQVTQDIKTAIADAGDPILTSTPASSTFTLTTGQDYADTSSSFKNGGLISSTFKFTSGNETVTAGAGSLGNTDALVDGTTTDADVLDATLTSGAAATTTIQNIETLNLTSTIANSGLDFANVLGAKKVALTGTANSQLTSINANAAPAIEVNNFNKVLTLNSATWAGTTAAGTAESLTVKVSGLTAGGTVAAPVIPGITLTATAAGSLETLNLESAGTSKNTVNLALGAGANAVTKTVVTGAADLDLRVTQALINGQTLDGAAHTGALNLVVDRDTALTAVTNLTNATGVDIYTFRDSTAGGDALVASGLADASTVVLTYGTTGASSLAVKGAASSTTNVLNLTLDHATDATDIAVATSLTVADVETLNIKSEGGTTTGNSIAALTVNTGSKVTVDGATKLDLQLAATSTVTTVEVKGAGAHKVDFAGAATYLEAKNLTIDGSAATGKLTLDGSDFTGTAGGVAETLTIKGGTTDDTITATADANAKNVIDAGAGVDTVNVATANNSNVTLGTGADKVTVTGLTGAGSITFTDWALGTGGDVLSVSAVTGITFNGVAGAIADTKLTVWNAALANNAAFQTTIDGATAGAKVAVLAINNATGVAELWYDASAGGAASAVKIASFENITTVGVLTDATSGFTAANFGTWA